MSTDYIAIKEELISEIKRLEEELSDCSCNQAVIFKGEDGKETITVNKYFTLNEQLLEAYKKLSEIKRYLGPKSPSPKYTNVLTEKQYNEMNKGRRQFVLSCNFEKKNVSSLAALNNKRFHDNPKSKSFILMMEYEVPYDNSNIDDVIEAKKNLEVCAEEEIRKLFSMYGIRDFHLKFPNDFENKLCFIKGRYKLPIYVRTSICDKLFSEMKAFEPIYINKAKYRAFYN